MLHLLTIPVNFQFLGERVYTKYSAEPKSIASICNAPTWSAYGDKA